jgi:hypothetical protein
VLKHTFNTSQQSLCHDDGQTIDSNLQFIRPLSGPGQVLSSDVLLANRTHCHLLNRSAARFGQEGTQGASQGARGR